MRLYFRLHGAGLVERDDRRVSAGEPPLRPLLPEPRLNATPVAADQAQLRLQAGGTLNPRRHLYIERPDDQTLLKLLSEGQYVNVLTSRQMGKSSLMVRTAEVLTKRGVRCAIVDLAAELGTPEDATAYFLGLLNKIARDLKIKVDLPTWWAERADETMNQRLMRFFREVVLEQVPGPVVCFLDEIDSTLKLALDRRPVHRAARHAQRAAAGAGVRAAHVLPHRRRLAERADQGPPHHALQRRQHAGARDFDLARDDLTPLIDALGANTEQGRRLIERVLHWTGGHPYLTARLCASLDEIGAQAPEDVDRRVDDAFRSLERVSGDVHFQQVLRFLETRVANGLATFGLYEKILKGARERDQPAPAHTELKLSGLVKRDEEGCLVVRNRIYERLFDRRWIESTRPRRALKTTGATPSRRRCSSGRRRGRRRLDHLPADAAQRATAARGARRSPSPPRRSAKGRGSHFRWTPPKHCSKRSSRF